MRAGGQAAALVVLLMFFLSGELWACAVCFDPREENRIAFLATTVFLSLVPLGMVGGLGLWLRRRARALRGLPSEGAGPPGGGGEVGPERR